MIEPLEQVPEWEKTLIKSKHRVGIYFGWRRGGRAVNMVLVYPIR